MIEVLGETGTTEHDAACSIRDAIVRHWPGIEDTPEEEDFVRIMAGVKLSGYQVSDIDVFIAARFSRHRYIVPKRVFIDADGKRVSGAKVRVSTFIAAIEVKDHDAAGVQMESGGIMVRYKEGWKSATEQNERQRYALVSYLKDERVGNVFVYRCVMLRGVDSLRTERGRQVPDAGAIAGNFSAADLFMAAACVNQVKQYAGEYGIRSCALEDAEAVLSVPLFTTVIPSRLDRGRMDRIAARPKLARKLGDFLGDKRVHLRGHGGTGKTVLMLQAAHEAYQKHGKRISILTYNHALAADIQRSLALLGIPAPDDGGGIDIRTVMSFTYAWLFRLGVLGQDEDPHFDAYEEKCREALSLINEGAVTDADVKKVKKGDPNRFDYDAIVVEEAQDWPQSEADLLCTLYGRDRVSLVDGIAQLVRGRATSWESSAQQEVASESIYLEECLRMKANLALFANGVAKAGGLNIRVEPNPLAKGGRVIISNREYAKSQEIWKELGELARGEGNLPIDFLHCVPPSEVSLDGNRRSSVLASAFEAGGFKAWDGVDPALRRDFPRSVEALRVVQYESCRGLEGWIAVLDGLDEFWERKRQEALDMANEERSMASPEDRARSVAWRWVQIAITRPIDTLYVTLRDTQSELSRTLLQLARENPDVVELRDFA